MYSCFFKTYVICFIKVQIEENECEAQMAPKNQAALAQAAWRSGHRIRLRIERSGFDSRQGIRIFRETILMLCVKLT
jgi:hypothetical protein